VAYWGDNDDGEMTTTQQHAELPSASVRKDRAYLTVVKGRFIGEMFRIEDGTKVIGRGTDVDILLREDGVSRRHVQLTLHGDTATVVDLKSTNGSFVNGVPITAESKIVNGDLLQVGAETILKFSFQDALDESYQKHMYESALIDGLTKIFNRKYFGERLESELAYYLRHRTSLYVILLDVDHFKKTNDDFGHLAGDYVLSRFAEVVGKAVRSEDVLARYGGEEFIVMCRNCDEAGVRAVANRIVKDVAAATFVFEGRTIPVRVSAGVAPATAETRTAEQLVGNADDALYQAKKRGRNQAIYFGE
jgi:two-component system cell cycle response regulator